MFDTKLSESPAPMKLSVTVIAKVLACLILFIWLPPTAEAARKVLLGVSYNPVTPNVQDMETWQGGKKHAVVNLFTAWCDDTRFMADLFTVRLPNRWNNGNIPMITWEPTLQCEGTYSGTYTSTPDDVEVQASNRVYDLYLHSWADQLKTFLAGNDGVYGGANDSDDRRVYLRLGHEMNGTWYKWGADLGNNLPTDYIAMWQHVKNIFNSKGLDANHVQWVWSVNNEDFPMSNDAELYYPGDDYVDWVAIDGYNRGGSSWKTPHEVFNDMATRLHNLTTKPLAITEVGSTSTNRAGTVGDVGAKARWITNFFNQAVKNNDVKMVVWFNEDKEEEVSPGQFITNDWAVFGGLYGDTTFGVTYTVYTACQTAVQSSHFVGSNGTGRLLTNAQFKGR